jgi:hypothetical protein
MTCAKSLFLEAGVGIEPAYTALQASGGFFDINDLAPIHFRQNLEVGHFMSLFR